MVVPFSYTLQPPAMWVPHHDRTLPVPWKGLIDPSTGWLYFWNPVTNVTQYERPSAPLYYHHYRLFLQQNPHPWLLPTPPPSPPPPHHEFYLQQNPYPWLPPPHHHYHQFYLQQNPYHCVPRYYDWPRLQICTCHPPSALHQFPDLINHLRYGAFILEQGQDRISELPDELIMIILSFLPTRSALMTTFLSKRWNKLWTSVRHLDLDIQRDMNREKSRSKYNFEKLVYFVFRRLSSSDIEKFRLVYADPSYERPGYNPFYGCPPLYDFVAAAVSRNVVELDLRIVDVFDPYYFTLPGCIFSCKTLKVLKLCTESLSIPARPTSSECFPSLKILHLTVMEPQHGLENILSYFPVLEELSIHIQVQYVYYESHHIIVKVSTPELKTLRLSMERDEQSDEYIRKKYHFCVDAPKLENLEVVQTPLSHCSLENPESVVYASIAFKCLAREDWPSFSAPACQLLTGISNVKCLSLSDQPLKASNLPIFGNLNQLRLVIRDRNNWDDWEFLTDLLPNTPNLEDLDLVLEDGTDEDEDDGELHWNPPHELVPDCLLSNLKTMSIRGFKGLEVATTLAKYMLLYGRHLNKMTIYTCMLEKEEACKDLLTSPRAITCQVEFKEM